MQVTLAYAEAHLADLLAAAQQGEEIEIAQPEKPTVTLIRKQLPAQSWDPEGRNLNGVSYPSSEAYLQTLREQQDKERVARGWPIIANTPRILGSGVGKMIVPTEEEWRKMKEEDAREMNDAPLTTDGDNW